MTTKRIVIILCIAFVMLPLCVAQITGTRVTPVMLSSPQSRWVEVGTITASQAYPAVGDRDYTTVAALDGTKTFVWNIDSVTRKVQMSFQTSADADSTTIALLGFADANSVALDETTSLTDDAVYLGQLVLTGGQQTGKHSNVYVDTIVGTDGVASFSVLDSAANRRCIVEFQTKGYTWIVGIATTLQAGSTLYAEGRSFQ